MIVSSALAPGWPGVWGEAVAGLGRFHAFCRGRYAFADWDEALERLFGAVDEGLIILDEFPYMMKASPSLPSLIQRALGPRGEGAVGVVADPLRRSQIQVDAAVFAPDEPGRQRRVLSLGEAKWDKVMNPGHLERLRRARDLLAVKGYDTEQTRLICYSGARFDPELVDRAAGDPLIQLVGLEELYG